MSLKYSVSQKTIANLLALVDGGSIAIPEIQRPFVWEKSKVRDLLDSLYRGFPVGYIIIWQNPNVRLKNGATSQGKQILIDGQQRITALTTAILQKKTINKNYKEERIKISFNPLNEEEKLFEVHNSAIEKSSAWVKDVAPIITGKISVLGLLKDYCQQNNADEDMVFAKLQKLHGLGNAQIGVIDLSPDISIDEVTEIFIRINSKGVELSQADFAMSKIASNEELNGTEIRKAVDYFCHSVVKPEFISFIEEKDTKFAQSDFFQQMRWLKDVYDETYDPNYSDMLRVAFTSQFKRGKLADLVSLLSGRNFETREYEQEIIQKSFQKLTIGIQKFSKKYHFEGFVMLVKTAGFVAAKQIRSQNVLNFSYILYLTLLDKQQIPAEEKGRFVQRWLVMSILTGRYSASPESSIDRDIRQLQEQDPQEYLKTIEEGELSDAFWNTMLVQNLGYVATTNPQFNVFLAAQVRDDDYAFLSRTIKIKQLIELHGDIHHLFPKNHLSKQGFTRTKYNQLANYVYTQSEINRTISDHPPAVYMQNVRQAIQQQEKTSPYSSIESEESLKKNLRQHCIPDGFETMDWNNYEDFLKERQKLIAQRLKQYYFSL